MESDTPAEPYGKRIHERLLVAATLLAMPLTLGLEAAARHLFLPADLDELRAYLHAPATVAAWCIVPVAALVSVAGPAIQRRLLARALRPIPADAPRRRDAARVGAFFLAASVMQVPGLAAAVLFLVGASPVPVVAVMAVATAGIVRILLRPPPRAAS